MFFETMQLLKRILNDFELEKSEKIKIFLNYKFMEKTILDFKDHIHTTRIFKDEE